MAKKKNILVIRTLDDVVTLVNHNTSVIEHAVQKLKRGNRQLKIFSLLAIGCAIYSARKAQQREEELYQLSVRVRKLENKEGE